VAHPLVQTRLDYRTGGRIESAGGIVDAPRVLAAWHLASLDAPTVAVVWSLAFAWANDRRLALWIPLLLALTTWAVYVGDRLLDARSGLRPPAQNALRERHYFHWRHRHLLLPLAVVAACCAAGIVLASMGPVARERDSVLAAAAFVYFSGVHLRHDSRPTLPRFLRRLFSKEFLVGVLFTAGCVLPAWPRSHVSTAAASSLWPFWITAAFFAALAWLNCNCIARWEAADVARTTHRNRTQNEPAKLRSGVKTNRFAAALLAAAGILLALAAHASHPRAAALIATGALSALLLALLDRTREHITPLALRAAADLVLLTPMVLLLR
jgi:hypothetical protein